MNSIPRILRKNLFFFLLILFCPIYIFSQNTQDVWELIHQNKRQEALAVVNSKKFVTNIETLLLKVLVENENGIFSTDKSFIEQFKTFPDFENYLYAYWSQPYLFNNYREEGFNEVNLDMLKMFRDTSFQNTTLDNSLNYLHAIAARSVHDWSEYDKENAKINSIKLWEHCGVFENLNNSGLSIVYGPEESADNTTEFDGRSIGKVSWFRPNINEDSGYQFFGNHVEYGPGVNYAQTFIQSPKAQRVLLKLGKAGLVRIWLNDVLVFENDKDRVTEMDSYIIAANIEQGGNRLLVKIASETNTPYAIVRVEDEKNRKIEGLSYSLEKRDYNQSTEAKVDAKVSENRIVQFFSKKKEADAKENFQDDLNLCMTYIRTSNYEKAKELLAPWATKYPNSSFLNKYFITLSALEKNDIRKTELLKNLERVDPNYYLSLVNKFQDSKSLTALDRESFENTLEKIIKATDIEYLKNSAELLVQLRRNNLDSVKYTLHQILEDPKTPSNLLNVYANFFNNILKDEQETIKQYERIVHNNFNYPAISSLSYYYKKQNRREESLQLLKNVVEHMPEDNSILYDYIVRLHDFNQYEESLPYIDAALENYPFSSVFYKLKGDTYIKLNQQKKALVYYDKALERNNSNISLRKKINDLKNIKDPLESFRKKDYYAYINNTRNKIETNNYGINILLEQNDILAYKNGGSRYRSTFIYEVTSNKGVEILKEYDLGLSGNYTLLKSELIKPNKSIVPAERSGSNLVFNELTPGDVIYIDFEESYAGGGRFYKDFVDTQLFDSYYPIAEKTYRIITEKDALPYNMKNGSVTFKKFDLNDNTVYEWSIKDNDGIPLYEDYMPPFIDVAKNLNISTISSWSEISNWYSDLVRSQIIYDAEVKQAFTSIFPDGYINLSENERAKRIYEFITSDFTYSYVSFKQSGFVPQKPSKTIKTKLGDCKDFSTLFVTLAKEAELDAQLVLILTSENGKNALVLPSTDFNHCIAKVKIAGKDQYLELTDKYLPYKSLPTSLTDALALEIPFFSNDSNKNSLFLLQDVARNRNSVRTETLLEVGEDSSAIDLTTIASGYFSSFYHSMADERNENVLREDIYNELLTRTSSDVTLDAFKFERLTKKSDTVILKTQLTLNEKVSAIGSIKTFKLPFFTNPYTPYIVNLDKRNYIIDYKQYETGDDYYENFTVKIPEGTGFIELPEDKYLTFNDHSYKVSYDKVKNNELKIAIISKPGKMDITPEKYPAFRKFVKDILDTRKQFIAYK